MLHKRKVDDVQWVPQATLKIPVDFFRKRGIKFHEGNDDLDQFVGSDLLDAEGRMFILRSYRGYPKGTTTVYLPFELDSASEIKSAIATILRRFEVPQNALSWQRYSIS